MSQQQQRQAGLPAPPLADSQNRRNKDEHIVNIPPSPVMSNISITGARKEGQSVVTQQELKRDEANGGGGEAGIFHLHKGRRKHRKKETGGDAGLVEGGDPITAMGKFYRKVLNFSIGIRYLVYILPLGLCLLVPILVGLYSAPDATIGASDDTRGVRIVWFFTWLEVVWCSLWVSKLFAKALPTIFRSLVGAVSSGVKKYASVIQGLEIPISLVGWSIASLCSFLPLMTRNPDQKRHKDLEVREWQRRTNLALISCVVSTIVYLGEKLIIQIVSVDYRRRQFAQRIKTYKDDTLFLSQLYEASRGTPHEEFKNEDFIIQNPNLSSVMAKQSESATPMHVILGNINFVGDMVTSAFGNALQEVTGNKNVLNPNSPYVIVSNALGGKQSSEALARRIWMSCAMEGSTKLTKKDLLEVMGQSEGMGEDREKEVSERFSSLDRDGNGDVSLEEMVMHVVHLHNEKRDVERSWQDVGCAIQALDSVLSFIVFAIVVLVFVVTQQSNVGTTLAGAGTVLISLSFVFALTAQELLSSCIFLFVKHPFDVGDRVDIDDKRFLVERISLLYTVFKRVETNKITQIPNGVLSSLWIENISRSDYMQEPIKFWVNYDTTLEDIQELRKELRAFVGENSRDFHPELEVEVLGLNELDKLQVKVEVKYKSNWANEALTCQRRNKFLHAMVKILKKIPIYGVGMGEPLVGEEANPMFTVAISDDKAHEYMDKADNARKGLRWDRPQDDPSSSPPRPPPTPTKGKGPSSSSSASTSGFSATDHLHQNLGHRRSTSQGGNAEEEGTRREEGAEEVRTPLARESSKGRRMATQDSSAGTSANSPQQQGRQGQQIVGAAPPYSR